MPALGEFVNVYNSALAVLAGKGFQVWFNAKADMFCAERAGWDFMAENPISLLGLVAIYEAVQPPAPVEYWWRQSGHLDYQNLPGSPQPYSPVVLRRPTPS
jgi:hypothetical protein